MRRCALLPALLALCSAIVVAPGPASAADTLELPAAGLVFVPDDRIAIEAQEIVLGRAAIKVSYAVRNRSAQPVARIVSFALPEIDMAAIGDEVVVLPNADPRNFLATAVAVDGQQVALGFEQRAIAFGRDVTALLERAGVPVNPLATGVEEALRQLPPEAVGELEERGAIQREDERLTPVWSVRTTAFWRQVLEPGRLITIGLAYGTVTASGTWGPTSLAETAATFCIDKDLEAAIAARAAKAGRSLVMHSLTFAGAGTAGAAAPVPNFRLAIEKPGFETLIATCRRDLRTVGPTLLEWIGHDVSPAEDIRVLFID